MDTSKIGYNYKIAKALFDNTKNRRPIREEIKKIIQLQIDLIIARYQLSNPVEQLAELKKVFFKNVLTGQGQLGSPQIKIDGKYKYIQTVQEFREPFINSLNFRELMSMMRNFASVENDCIMYSILVEYSEAKNSQDPITNTSAFKNKYPMLDINVVDEAVIMIEKIIGFDISETSNCYDNLNGSKVSTCTRNTKPYYQLVQDAHIQQKTKPDENLPKSPITLCWLWHPLVYGVPYQDVVKLPYDNFVKRLNNSYEPVTEVNKKNASDCMIATYRDYPIFPNLSQREQNYLGQTVKLQKNIDGDIINPPWNPPYCYMKRSEPTSFMLNLLDRHGKYSVSNLSGHVMIFIMMSKYFKSTETDGSDTPINIDMIILASILFMVPYNHSIHEIFQSAKMMGVNTNYSVKKNDLDNVNDLLKKNGMEEINITLTGNSDLPTNPNKRKSIQTTRTNVSSFKEGLEGVKGGKRRKTKRNGKRFSRKTCKRKHVGYKSKRINKKSRKSKKSRKYKRTKNNRR